MSKSTYKVEVKSDIDDKWQLWSEVCYRDLAEDIGRRILGDVYTTDINACGRQYFKADAVRVVEVLN